MPKAFLLTNKRYKIWKQIKETFKEEQQKRLLLQQQGQYRLHDDRPGDSHDNHPYLGYSNHVIHGTSRLHDDTTDYSKYTNTIDEEDHATSQLPSPAVSPTSMTSSSPSSPSSDDSDSGYSYTTENRPISPSIEFGLDCRRPHISYFYDLMTSSSPLTPLYKSSFTISHDQNIYKPGLDFQQRVGQIVTPIRQHLPPPPQQQQQQQQQQPLPVYHNHDIDAPSIGEEEFVCPDCGKRYSTSSNLARHRQTHRASTDKKARKCPHCEKMYVSMPAYSMHVRTHSQGCECKHCGKRFSRPWLLQGHVRTHTGEKPFKCVTCSKSFADKSNLRAHTQTHSTEKPFACGRCGKAFALKSYLYKHEESSCMRGQRFKEH